MDPPFNGKPVRVRGSLPDDPILDRLEFLEDEYFRLDRIADEAFANANVALDIASEARIKVMRARAVYRRSLEG
jgi:hypothetical protein